jgi:hypothetical protein
VSKVPADIKADNGFGLSPDASEWKPDLSKYPPDIAEKLKKREKTAPDDGVDVPKGAKLKTG